MTAAWPGHHALGSCPSGLHHVPNMRQAPSHWPLVMEWRAEKGLLQVREGTEAPVMGVVSIAGMSNCVPTRASRVSGSTKLGLSAGSKPVLSI